MSADNWSICPKCKVTAEHAAASAATKARESYGNVPVEQYQRMIDEADKIASKGLEDTLREDFSVGVKADGTFEVIYGCRCGTCGFAFTFKHSEPTKGVKP